MQRFVRFVPLVVLGLSPVACGGGSSSDTENTEGAGGTTLSTGGGAGKAGSSGAAAGKGGASGSAAGKGGASGGGAGAGGTTGGSAGATGGTGGGGKGGTAGTGGATGGKGGASGASGSSGAGGAACACKPTEICVQGACVTKITCATNDDCQNDTFCDPAQKACVPWTTAMPPDDATCIHVTTAGVLSPTIGCEFTKAPAGDAFPGHVDVQGTPIVVPFDGGKDSIKPVIAASFTATVVSNYTEDLGVIRVLDGGTCALDANLGGTDLDGDGKVDWTVSSASLAAADLDGDGAPEIVAYGSDGTVLAFTRKANAWKLLWKSAADPVWVCNAGNHRCPGGWAGPSIHDLDDDGKPEILREGRVYSSTGKLLSGAPPGYVSYSQGLFDVVANIDEDPAPELVNGDAVWSWKAGAWVKQAYFAPAAGAPGFVALADFGAYGTGVPATAPEIVVVRNDSVIIYDRTGGIVLGPIAVPGTGGGPPTIADFDGDGLPEVAVAAKAFYTVFDPDCTATPRPGGKCNNPTCDSGPCPKGVLWSKSTQDISSSVTGSSVFDFEGDGVSEVVYGDECFTRVYSGTSGEVIFSQYRSSCTWYENPVIADTDGNFRADLVVPSNKACSPTGDGIACGGLTADGVDAQFNGLRCKTGKDCVSGSCDAGLCRCTTSAQCCTAKNDAACIEAGTKCAAPNAGTPGTGNTCRASHPHGTNGIRVYRDANDQWVKSRAIWNQHAYAVTNVGDLGTVPKTSAWKANWLDKSLNNFRQNVPGSANVQAVPDLTSKSAGAFTCTGGKAHLSAIVCNRGADKAAAGIAVSFSSAGMTVCGATTTGVLQPGVCETVTCDWASPPKTGVDVTVSADGGGSVTECHEGNNTGTIPAVFCPLGLVTPWRRRDSAPGRNAKPPLGTPG
jgi:hypothetical protein